MKTAVHFHVFYKEMVQGFLEKLKILVPNSFDLFVTTTSKDEDIESLVKQHYSSAKIWVVPNKGYDVGPFFYFLHQIDLNQYDLVLKIHTKNSKKQETMVLNHQRVMRGKWSNLLINGLLSDKKQWNNNLQAFDKYKNLGMVASKYVIVKAKTHSSKKVFSLTLDELSRIKGLVKFPKNFSFVAGTMFLVRAKLLQPLKDTYTIDSFEETNSSLKDGTKAHIVERIIGAAIEGQNYQIKGFDFDLKMLISFFVGLFFQKKITRSGKLIIRFFKIPIYHGKIK